MKNKVLLIFFITGLFSQVHSQSSPFLGYDRVAWGTSIDAVRTTYNMGDEVEVTEFDDEPNIVQLTQRNVSSTINSRDFMFNRWNSNDFRLYRVIVYYRVGSIELDALRRVLESSYGSSTGTDYRTEETSSVIMNQTVTIFDRFSPDILVELMVQRERYKSNFEERGTFFSVWYTWKTYRDAYQNSRVEL